MRTGRVTAKSPGKNGGPSWEENIPKIRVVDPDPHSECGSGSRKEMLKKKPRKRARKLLIIVV